MNKWLHGNGHWCPCCGGRGVVPAGDCIEMIDRGGASRFFDFPKPCPHCRGERRLLNDAAR